jgi:hypothetical protein
VKAHSAVLLGTLWRKPRAAISSIAAIGTCGEISEVSTEP